MTSQRFFHLMDVEIAAGLGRLDSAFAMRHAAYVRMLQSPGGGFPGRRGEADLYYTDFAVRVLALADPRDEELAAVARFLATMDRPASFVEAFNVLNLARLLASHGQLLPVDHGAAVAALAPHRLAQGGFSRSPGVGISAYATFLGSLCQIMTGGGLPPRKAGEALATLRCIGGGYRESADAETAEANATAAVVASLVLCGAEDLLDRAATAAFLSGLQAMDGGLRSHDRAPCSDLLSSFTGLVTLGLLECVDVIDLAGLARFAQSMQSPGGGFRSCGLDTEPDIEYTYYGLGTIGLLGWYAMKGTTKE